MINVTNKRNCCGCEACVQICPMQCILLEQDNEGFLYPRVNKDLCVDCGLCEKTCPVINKREQTLPLNVWAAQNNDDEIRKESSSGGVASLLAEKIIDDGGVVFGVSFNEKWEAVHTYAETKEQLTMFRGSKYVQSRIGDSFFQVKELLKTDRRVLFVGTPCQVSGLKLFLRKDYPNLITVDFICHGVPSPGIFKWYLQEELNKYEAARKDSEKKSFVSFSCIHSIPKGDILLPEKVEIVDIRFRDKREGWKKYSFVLSLTEVSADGKKNIVSLSTNVSKNTFLRGFCSDLYLRPSCHQCPVRNFRSGSDITIADFWGQEYMFPEFDKDTGVSSVIVKSEKGGQLFSSIDNVKKEKKTIEQVLSYNPSLIHSKGEPYTRKKFWGNYGKYSLEETIAHAVHLNYFERAILKIKKILK